MKTGEEITPVFSIVAKKKKILAIFRGIFTIFSEFQNSYVFSPLFLSESPTAFCGTLFEKHWPVEYQV
jgi:hypothetical protein